MDDPLVAALRVLVEREGGWVAVGDAIGHNDQSIYQILKGIRLPSGKPKGVGPNLRKKLDTHYPGWLSLAASPVAGCSSPGAPGLAAALPVVLAHLPGLDGYTADKVMTAINAAIKGSAPLEVIELDLVHLLTDSRAQLEQERGKPRAAA
jgi:hypothetical protein